MPSEQGHILVVDDYPTNRLMLSIVLKKGGHIVAEAESGAKAIEMLHSNAYDLVLLDISMPDMDGYEVCQRLKADKNLKGIPVIFISALTETLDKVKAFSAGGVDYVTKPFQQEEIQSRVETHLNLRRLQLALEKTNSHLQDLVQAQVKEISDSQMATIFAMARLAESRDKEMGMHLERVQIFCQQLATRLSQKTQYVSAITPEYIQVLFLASPLHDIGKVSVPDHILLKPGKLTVDEFELMKTHTSSGAQTLTSVQKQYPGNAFINMGIDIARSHHEKWDGSGYPEGLKEEDIPLSARIMALADVYDALRSKRPYKPLYTHKDSCEIILNGRGTHFEPTIVEAFEDLQSNFEKIWEKAEA